MTHPQVRRIVLVMAATALLGSVSACTSSSKHSAAPTTPTPTTSASTSPAATSTSATPTPTRKPKPPAINPLTGVGGVPKNPVIVVKIDDTAPGRPQLNIDKADVVYIEAVEAGLTRTAAVFASNLPTAVGYVRSTRPSDPELLRQYGKITEAFSGGQRVSTDLARKAGFNLWSNDAGKAYYHRASRAGTTYINVVLDVAALAKHVKTARPTSNGWTFRSSMSGLPTGTGTDLRTEVTGSYPAGDGTPVEFRWDAKRGKYVRYIGGVRQLAADGKPIAATNVVVQSCKVTSFTRDRDVNGNPAQFTSTIGTGALSVFRGGKRIQGTWTRKSMTTGTVLRTTSGAVLPLQPGNTWVVLIRHGIAVHG